MGEDQQSQERKMRRVIPVDRSIVCPKGNREMKEAPGSLRLRFLLLPFSSQDYFSALAAPPPGAMEGGLSSRGPAKPQPWPWAHSPSVFVILLSRQGVEAQRG